MRNLLLKLLLIITQSTYGQTWEVEIIVNRGNNINLTNGRKISTGDSLKFTDSLLISKDGFVGLISKSGKTAQIKGSGSYLINEYFNFDPDSCSIYWLDDLTAPEPENIIVEINHSMTAKIYPSTIRIDFKSSVHYDSATISLMNICNDELSTLTTLNSYFNINLEDNKFLNLRQNEQLFEITGYIDNRLEKSRVNYLEMVADDQIGLIKYDLRRASNLEDTISIFNRNFLYLNSYYLKKN